MRTVLNMLSQAGKEFPNSNYLNEKSDNGWIGKTYLQVDKISDLLAISLIKYGINQEDKIAILSEGRTSWVIAEYGILKTRSIAVPLSVKLLPEEILFRLNHSEAKAIFISRNTMSSVIPILDKIENKNFMVICFDEDDDTNIKLVSALNKETQKLLYFDPLLREGALNITEYTPVLNQVKQNITENTPITLSYTSGTSGNPKGILLTHLNYYANSHNAFEYFRLEKHLKTLVILPLDHSFAHTVGIYISLISALSIYFVDSRAGSKQTLKNIPLNLKEVKPDMLLTVPALTGNFMKKISDGIEAKGGIAEAIFKMGVKSGIALAGDGHHQPSLKIRLRHAVPYFIADKIVFNKVRQIFGGNLKFCVGGGALLDIKQQHFFYAIGVPIFQGYGLTEATPIISANCNGKHKIGTSGGVISNIACKIMNDGVEVPRGQKGEICIQGLNVMLGYFKNPEATSETLRDGWLHTGDLGYFDEDNYLMVVGRAKALLISEDGEKYSPEEIEEAISISSPYILQTMLHNDHNKFTSAIITLDKSKVEALIKKYNLTSPEQVITEIHQSLSLFQKEEDYINKFPSKWVPSVFRIAPEPFSEDNKMINSTLKMVRHKITEAYQYLIDDMYLKGTQSAQCEHNIKVVQQLFNL